MSDKNTKYIFVTGGVVSSLGKGLAASSSGCLLEARGMTVQMMKLDPYINVDPGTMSPFQHGEVFVTDDGAETDLDLGHYERFTHARMMRANNCTAGRIYESIIIKELREIGIQPDVLLCRTDRYLAPDLKAKIALFCSVPEEAVITAKNVEHIYEVPLVLAGEGLDTQILRCLRLETGERNVQPWIDLVERLRHPAGEVSIGIVGKYVELQDSYKSLHEALTHGGLANDVKARIVWVEAEELAA